MELRIAQYNAHKRRDTMVLLYRNNAKYDVIAVQEPARNRTMHATYCDSNSVFRPLYPTNRHTRACFLINKKLPLAHWGIEFPGSDIAILTLRLPNRTVTVTNVYSEPTNASQVNESSPSTHCGRFWKGKGTMSYYWEILTSTILFGQEVEQPG